MRGVRGRLAGRLALVAAVAVTGCGGAPEAASPTTTTPTTVTSTSSSTTVAPATVATTPPTTVTTTTTTTTAAPTTTAPPTTVAPPAYTFPVDPPSATDYGPAHHDYPAADIFAPCGSPVLAPTAGVVDEVTTVDVWDPAVDDGATRGGLSVSIVGGDGVRYYGSHLSEVAVAAGQPVGSGSVLGAVGDTGNARGTGCHLHFGISPPCGQGDWWIRRGVVAPYPYLQAWEVGGQLSPAEEVSAWRAAHPADCPAG